MIQYFTSRLIKALNSPAARGFAILLCGTSVSNFLPILATPAISRLYTPSDIGTLSIFTAVVLALTPVMSLCYCYAIPIPRNNAESSSLLSLSILLSILSAFFLLIVLALCPQVFLGYIGISNLAKWKIFIVVACFASSTYESLYQWLIRKREYSVISGTTVIKQLSSTVAKISLGAIGLGPAGLIFSQTLGPFTSVASVIKYVHVKIDRSLFSINATRLYCCLRKYVSFPINRIPSHLLLVVAQQYPFIAISSIYGLSNTGSFAFALNTISMPLGLIGSAAGQTIFAEASNLGIDQNRTRIFAMVNKVQTKLIQLTVVPITLIWIYGRNIFSFVFGPEWLSAGSYASTLALYALLQLVSAPLIKILTLFESQRLFLCINLVRALLILSLFAWVNCTTPPFEKVVSLYSYVMTLFYLVVCLVVYSKLKPPVLIDK